MYNYDAWSLEVTTTILNSGSFQQRNDNKSVAVKIKSEKDGVKGNLQLIYLKWVVFQSFL
jgi:hypothetical protein